MIQHKNHVPQKNGAIVKETVTGILKKDITTALKAKKAAYTLNINLNR